MDVDGKHPVWQATYVLISSNFRWILALVLLQAVVYQLARVVHRAWFHPLSGFPGPRLYGVTYLPFLFRNYIQGAWGKNAAALHRRYGPVVRIGPSYLMVDGASAWSDVFGHKKQGQAEFRKAPAYFDSADHLSIVNASFDDHRRMKRVLSPAFAEAALSEQEPILLKHVDLMIARLSESADRGQPVNIVELLLFTTFDIIGELGFSQSLGCLDNDANHHWVLSAIQGAQGTALRQFFDHYPLLRSVIECFNLSSTISRGSKNRSLARDKADRRIEYISPSSGAHRDYMTYMLGESGPGGRIMSEQEIQATSGAIFVGGSETTATALSGLMYFLSNDPERYELVANEVRSRYASGDEINSRNTLSLQYLCACIEETLRLYPPVADLPPRVSPGGIVGDRFIPAGTRTFVSMWATFRSPAHFKDADAFRPERWLPKSHPQYDPDFEADDRIAMKPFSYGPRDCLGQSLAYLEMRLIASKLLFFFDFELERGERDWLQQSQRSFILWDKGPLRVTLRPSKGVR